MESGVTLSRDLRLAYCRWRNGAASWRALAVHGWMDNAASFEVLAPLLNDADVVAVDLPGHGASESRPPAAGYNLWDDLPDLVSVADHLGWERFNLIGHSKGAIISALLAVAKPERVERLIMLEGGFPGSEPSEGCVTQLRAYLRDATKSSKRLPCYDDLQAATAARLARMPLAPEAAARLIARGTRKLSDGRIQWRNDPRIVDASAMKFDEAQSAALLENLSVPGLMLLAEPGAYGELMRPELRRMETSSMIRTAILPGSHHFHMEGQARSVAGEILKFIAATPASLDARATEGKNANE